MRIDVLISRWWMYGDKVLDEEQAKGTPVSEWTCLSDSAFHIIIGHFKRFHHSSFLKKWVFSFYFLCPFSWTPH